MSFCTTAALAAGWYAKAGQAAVVGNPAKSMLSLIGEGNAVQRQRRGIAALQVPRRAGQQRGFIDARDPDGVVGVPRHARQHFSDHLPRVSRPRE